ncbi:MAG: amidohydrolase family protein [Longimicrobiales bacterium]|nr:amidohydrolase family protein [Longimicrobiales bacterium]
MTWTQRGARVLPAGIPLLLALLLALPAGAQTVAVRGATLHTLAGEPVVGNVVAVDGRITAVGPDAVIPAGASVIDGAGRHVYPGLFDAATQLGLTEIGAVDVTNDSREQGLFNPHLRAMTAVHPPSEHIPVARANGVTHTLTLPRGGAGGIAGQGSLLNLDGWTVEEMVVAPGAALVVEWPRKRGGPGRFGGFGPGAGGNPADLARRYQDGVEQLTAWFEAARNYRASWAGGPVGRDLRLEALGPVLDGTLPLLIAADDGDQVRDAVTWAEEQGVRVIIAGANAAGDEAGFLAERGVGVILGPTQRLPGGPDAPYDEAYALPGRFHQAGVKIAFGTFNSSDSRTLPYEAAQAVPFGLPREAALRAVTVNAAELLGLGGELGTLEVGKRANFIVTDGDPLVIQTRILNLIIDGREVDTMNRHRALYERYRARPLPGGRR